MLTCLKSLPLVVISKVNAGLMVGLRPRNGISEILKDKPTHYYPLNDRTGVPSGSPGAIFRNVANSSKPLSRGSSGWSLEVVDPQVGNCLEGVANDTSITADDAFGFCWEGWVKADNPNQSSKGIFGNYNGNGWMLYTGGGLAGVSWYYAGTAWNYDLTKIWLPNKWTHFAALWDGKTTFYHIVNGAIIGQSVVTIAAANALSHCIGYYNNDLNTAFIGLRSMHVAYWNSPSFLAANMTPKKIAEHYEVVKNRVVDRRTGIIY